MMAGLLLVAEFRVVSAARRFSRCSSLSMVTSMGIRSGLRTSSRSLLESVTAKRRAAMAVVRRELDVSWRQVCM